VTNLGVFTELVLESAVDELHVPHSTGTGSLPPDRLLAPLVCTRDVAYFSRRVGRQGEGAEFCALDTASTISIMLKRHDAEQGNLPPDLKCKIHDGGREMVG
jgi:hypothetical protein